MTAAAGGDTPRPSAWAAVDLQVRGWLPGWLDLLPEASAAADALRALPAITGPAGLDRARAVVRAVWAVLPHSGAPTVGPWSWARAEEQAAAVRQADPQGRRGWDGLDAVRAMSWPAVHATPWVDVLHEDIPSAVSRAVRVAAGRAILAAGLDDPTGPQIAEVCRAVLAPTAARLWAEVDDLLAAAPAVDAAAQLVNEVGAVSRAVADVLGTDLHLLVEDRLDARCAVLAGELASDDDHLAAEATLTVMSVLWPGDTSPPAEWWRTPVGRLVARSVGRDDAEAVTYSVAAAMLGITAGAVAQMMARAARGQGGSGGLESHPDGGITRSSVLARIASR